MPKITQSFTGKDRPAIHHEIMARKKRGHSKRTPPGNLELVGGILSASFPIHPTRLLLNKLLA